MIVLALAIVILLFGFVVFRGAPYLPTMRRQIDDAFELLDLQPGQTLLELGSGDGRVLAAAAKRGIYSVGYELNPLLVFWTKLRYFKHRKFITVRLGDFWQAQWPESDAMFVFLLDRYMTKLDKKIETYRAGKSYKLISFSFEIPGKKIDRSKKGIFLYYYR